MSFLSHPDPGKDSANTLRRGPAPVGRVRRPGSPHAERQARAQPPGRTRVSRGLLLSDAGCPLNRARPSRASAGRVLDRGPFSLHVPSPVPRCLPHVTILCVHLTADRPAASRSKRQDIHVPKIEASTSSYTTGRDKQFYSDPSQCFFCRDF